MDQEDIFETVIEPSIERLGLFGVTHDVRFDGRKFVVVHKVSKNVFTEFDAKLSRYLAAVKGRGLPMATVETKIRDLATDRAWTPYAPRHAASVPHALAIAGRLALGAQKGVDVSVGAWLNDEAGSEQSVKISADSIEMVERGLEICKRMGAIDFLEISGDFERIMARPLGSTMDMMSIALAHGTVSIPSVSEMGGAAWQGPIHGFDSAVKQAPAVLSFLGRARHTVAAAKEDAIRAFREAAEDRILKVNDALAGQPLNGYRLQSVTALVSRLKAGLGDTLLGLSEAAQITALDWAAEARDLPPVAETRDDPLENQKDIRPRLVKQ